MTDGTGLTIVQVTPYYKPHLGGVEIVAENLGRELVALGHSVTTVTTRLGRGPAGTPGHPTAANGEPPGCIGAPQSEGRVVRCRAIDLARTPVAPGMFPMLLSGQHPDVFHIHISQALTPEIALLAARARRARVVSHFHMDVDATRFPRLFNAYKTLFLGRVLRFSHKVIVLTEEQASFVMDRYGVLESAVAVIPNGVTTALTLNTPRAEQPHSPLRLLYVGRMARQKNIPRLIEAVAQLDFPVELTLCGDGTDLTELTSHAARVLAHRQVTFTGRVGITELNHWYAWADVLVSSSDREGMPLVFLEAMAMGLPIVATAVPGSVEVLGGAGVLTDPTAGALAAGIARIGEDAALWRQCGQVGPTYVRSWRERAAEVESLYRSIAPPAEQDYHAA